LELERQQRLICKTYKAEYVAALPTMKLGISPNVQEQLLPINGLRHPEVGDTCGWYVWAGESFSEDPGFFQPLHVDHLAEWCPEIMPYLGLAPGWRFLTTGDCVDVWFDKKLLDIS
jgi:hypothetical protein